MRLQQQLKRRRRIGRVLVADDQVVEVPTGSAVDEPIHVAQVVEVDDDARQREVIQLDVGRRIPTARRDEVEPEITEELVRALGQQEDIVPTLAEVVVLSGPAAQDVVAANLIEAGEEVHEVPVVAEDTAVVSVAVVDPVVASIAKHRLGSHRAVDDDVVAGASEVLDAVVTADQEVVAVSADQDVSTEPGSGVQRVVAGAALEDVVAVASKEDVVAVASDEHIVAFSAVEAIVAPVAVEGVVADIRSESVVAGSAAEHDVPAAVQRVEEDLRPVAQCQDQCTIGIERLEDDRRRAARNQRCTVEVEIRRVENLAHRVDSGRVAPDELGERVALELSSQVQTVDTLQVIETVAVL